MAYLDLAAFKLRSAAPPELIDALESFQVGWVGQQLTSASAWLDARLNKRYDAPFADPPPEIVQDWVARIVTLRCYLRRGVDPADEQFQEIKRQAALAEAEIKEAAEAVNGLFDLPLRADTNSTGINRGRPRHRSEHSPFVWSVKQRRTGRREDRDW